MKHRLPRAAEKTRRSGAREMKPSSYQPNKAELEEEFDMPGWSRDQLRKAFMRPLKARQS